MLAYFMAAVAVLALLFVMMSVKIVHQGYRYTLEHFGRFVRVAQPGINFVIPFDNAQLPGYLHLPDTAGRSGAPPPCVIMVNGADSVKEEP